MLVKIYTDGAARGNPDGPGGYGTILNYVDSKGVLHEREFSQGYVRTTNNRMELMAAITGLEALKRPCEVELYSDSKYLVDAFNQHWMTVMAFDPDKLYLMGSLCLQHTLPEINIFNRLIFSPFPAC